MPVNVRVDVVVLCKPCLLPDTDQPEPHALFEALLLWCGQFFYSLVSPEL